MRRCLLEISFGAPGSWKREAFWDEYVVSLRNDSDQPIELSSATLSDYAGVARAPGSDPWKLERESKTLEKRYRDAGVAFARMAAPRVIATTAEPTVAAGVVGSGGAATAAAVTQAVAITPSTAQPCSASICGQPVGQPSKKNSIAVACRCP